MSAEQIKGGKMVLFTYQITGADGRILERIDEPMNYVHGSRHGLLEKVEEAMEGHRVGDIVTVQLSPEEGFGPYDESLTFTDDIQHVPEQYHHVGADVEMHNEDGDTRTFRVSRIENGKLTVDGNHPLAGKTLIFTLNVLDVRDATPEEMQGEEPPPTPVLH